MAAAYPKAQNLNLLVGWGITPLYKWLPALEGLSKHLFQLSLVTIENFHKFIMFKFFLKHNEIIANSPS
jgi:hypothetical protein